MRAGGGNNILSVHVLVCDQACCVAIHLTQDRLQFPWLHDGQQFISALSGAITLHKFDLLCASMIWSPGEIPIRRCMRCKDSINVLSGDTRRAAIFRIPSGLSRRAFATCFLFLKLLRPSAELLSERYGASRILETRPFKPRRQTWRKRRSPFSSKCSLKRTAPVLVMIAANAALRSVSAMGLDRNY